MSAIKVGVTPSKRYCIEYDTSVYEEIGRIDGSFSLLPSRLYGISYVDFLRMARDKYGARLSGKKGVYFTVTFKDKTDAERMVLDLNERWSHLISTKEAINDNN